MSDVREVPLFPLGTVLFPGGLLPLKIFEQRYLGMIKHCLRDNTPFGVCLIREGREVGEAALPHAAGCLARIEHWDVPHPNLFAILARGDQRFRILDSAVDDGGLLRGRIRLMPDAATAAGVDPACAEVLRLAIERAGTDHVPGPIRLDDPDWVSYRLAEILPVTMPEKQALLEMHDATTRLAHIRELMLVHGIIEKVNKNN